MRSPRRFTTMQLAFWAAGVKPGRPLGPRAGWHVNRRKDDDKRRPPDRS